MTNRVQYAFSTGCFYVAIRSISEQAQRFFNFGDLTYKFTPPAVLERSYI